MLGAIGALAASCFGSPAEINSAMDLNLTKQMQELTEMAGMPRR